MGRRALSTGLLVLFALLTLKGAYDFALQLLFEFRIPYDGDAAIFLSLGRGIVNGLTPYIDLFETKPPGIFLVSALSIGMFDDASLARVAQLLVLLAYVPLIALPLSGVLVRSKALPRPHALCVGILTGLVFALSISVHAGQFFPESFGALFASAYTVHLFLRRSRWTLFDTCLAGVCIAGAIGFKEPFLFSCIAAALLLTPQLPHLVTRFIIPLGIAIAIVALVLFSLGALPAYLTIYLPVMMDPYFEQSGSLWIHILRFDLLLRHLAHFGVGWMLFLIAIVTSAFAAARSSLRRVCILVAIFLLMLGVALRGQFLEHHFIFAVPILLAFLLMFARDVGTPWKCLAALFLALHVLLYAPPHDQASRLQEASLQIMATRSVAQEIDHVLSACAEERYLLLGQLPWNVFGYTTHSPLGPGFFQYKFNLYFPYFIETFRANIHRAQIVLSPPSIDLPEEIFFTLREEFTREPWPCAVGLIEERPDLVYFFRKRP